MKDLTKKQNEEVDKIVEMGSLLTPTEGVEALFNAMGVNFIDCTPVQEREKRLKI